MVEVRSRSERRSEKKQSFVFVAFIATVAIVCFASGYMVGRNSAIKPAAGLATSAKGNKPIVKAPVETKPADKKPEKLTFYEALPKGDQPPLGSGINLPKEEAQAEAKVKEVVVSAEEVKKPIPAKVFEPTKVATSAPAPAPVKPKVDSSKVPYVLQVASYPQPDEAGQLLGRLTKGGYDVYVQQADLRSKGIWYRVFDGPITGKNKASEIQRKIETEIKVKPILRRH